MKEREQVQALIFRAPAEDAEAVRRLAAAEDRSIASLLRRALRDHLERTDAAHPGRDEREVGR